MLRNFLFVCSFFWSLLAAAQAYQVDPIMEDSSINDDQVLVVQNILLVGNAITKNQIIYREILIAPGDSINYKSFKAALIQSQKNVLNTGLFNFARIDWARIDSNKVQIVVQVTERWYTFPIPIFEIDDNNFNTWWEEKDFSRINYGFHVVRNNFRGRKEKVSLTAQFGFTERFRVRYEIPYISKNQRSGLGFNYTYNRLDQIAYTSENNKRLQYKSTQGDAIKNYSTGIRYTYRKEIFRTHTLGLEYDRYQIQDTVRELNPNYLGSNRLKNAFFSLYYSLVEDKRDNKSYPLTGSLWTLYAKKLGLGIEDNGVDLLNFSASARKYWDLKRGWYFATGIRGEYAANNNQPYSLQNGLGYSSTYAIRAYELYVIDGQNIGLAKAQLKYQIVKPREAEFGFVNYPKLSKFHYAFYLGVFGDAAYVEDNTGFVQNNLANTWLYSTGIGLDFISYYDVVLRTEFSINKLGESGIFIHFVAPI